MKCDKLTAYNVVATADVNPEVVDILGCTEWTGYDKDEVDAAIAELKEVYKDSVDVKVKIWERCKKAEDELRKTQRALWITRAEKARFLAMVIDNYPYTQVLHFTSRKRDESGKPLGVARTAMEWWNMFKEVESKCRAKAEEYK